MVQAITELQVSAPSNLYRILAPRISNAEGGEGSQTNARRFVYTLYPAVAGTLPLPLFSLDFFDPVAGRYRRAVTEPGEVEVVAGAREPAMVEQGGLAKQPFLTPAPGERPRLPFSPSAILVLFPLLALVSLGNLYMTRRRIALEGDPVAGRRCRARQVARAQLAAAAELLRGGDCAGALTRMEKALKGYVADKLGIAAAGALYTTLGERLAGLGMDAGLVEDFLAHSARLGDLRYGGAPAAGHCRQLLDESRVLLKRLGKGWP
jgi:hypothetical protein